MKENLNKIQKVMKIKKSNIKGADMGAFMKKDVPKGKFLGWYRGKLLNENQRNKLKDDGYVWVIDIDGKEMFIDGKPVKKNNKLRYVNGAKTKEQKKLVNVDSYQYNKQIRYRTIKKVKKGEELIIDYGDDYWEEESLKSKFEDYETKTKVQKAVKKGVLWCINLFEKEHNFNSQAPNYIVLLFGLLCLECKSKFSNLIQELLIETLERASKKIKTIYKNDGPELVPVFGVFGKLPKNEKTKELFNKFHSYYKCCTRKKMYEGNTSFNKSIKDKDFDSLSDEAVSYSFLRLSKKFNKNMKLPKDRLNQYKKELEKLEIPDLEKIDKENHSELDYHVTHVVFVYNLYNCDKNIRKTKLIKQCESYILKNSGRILKKSNDIDLIGETLDCMLVLKNRKWNKIWKKRYINHILKKQTKSGKWYTRGDKSLYDKFHGNWAVLGALYHLF
jgi:hypothetical protein